MVSSWLISAGACLVTAVWALQADEQTHIHDPLENPLVPSEEFLWRLQHPRTLLAFENAEYQSKWSNLKQWLVDGGHKVREVVGPAGAMALVDPHGNWLQDNIVIIGNSLGVGKTAMLRETMLRFIDTPWLLPDAYGKKRDDSLLLPPSITLFADPHCSESTCGGVGKDIVRLAKQLGFMISGKSQELDQSQTEVFGSSLVATTKDLDFIGAPHEFTPNNSQIRSVLSPTAYPEVSGRSFVSIYQGERYWSRIAFISSGNICSDLKWTSNDANRQLCQDILNWVTHRRDVLTWSNLQHYKIHSPRTWPEYVYNAQPQIPEWTLTQLQSLDLSRPYLYRIRDEILFSLDFFELQRDPATKEFQWAPHQKPRTAQGTYFMMVPYNEEVMVPYLRSDAAASPLMRAWKKYEGKFEQSLKLNEASHWIHFKAPVQHGIHKMIVRSFPSLMTSVWMETIMPLRTYKHDEGPQTFWEGWPYYTPWICTAVGFVALLILWPYMKTGDEIPTLQAYIKAAIPAAPYKGKPEAAAAEVMRSQKRGPMPKSGTMRPTAKGKIKGAAR